MERLLVYMAHPYGGEKNNEVMAASTMIILTELDRVNSYVSPIHNFGMMYFSKEYEKGLDICLRLLSQCDALVLAGDWQNSKVCMGEYGYATASGIEIYTFEEWLVLLEKRRLEKGI